MVITTDNCDNVIVPSRMYQTDEHLVI